MSQAPQGFFSHSSSSFLLHRWRSSWFAFAIDRAQSDLHIPVYGNCRMQGAKCGGDPPKPDDINLESEVLKEMRKAGYDRAQAEERQKQGMVETIQAHTSHIKDKVAEKMDKLGATAKNTVK